MDKTVNLEKLIQDIVTRVVGQMVAEKGAGQGAPKDSVVILGQRECRYARALEKHLGPSCTFFYKDPGVHLDLQRVVPFLSLTSMADLASGCARTPGDQAILDALLAGKPVEVMTFEYRGYEKTAPEGLLRVYEAHEKALASFGMTALDLERCEVYRCRKLLITGAEIEQAKGRGAGSMLIPHDAKVTALAQDNAKKAGITISRGQVQK